MLKVFICEDNNIERKKYEKIIRDIIIIENLDMEVVISTDNPNKVIEYLEENTVSGLYFLDVDLKNEMNGIILAEKIRNYDPRGFIVFVTTHAEMSYLTFIYKIEAMDYIIKDNYLNIRNRINECILNANRKFLSKATDLQKNFTVKVDDKVISIGFDNILFFEISETIHKVIIHAKDRSVEFYSKMKDIEDKLDNRFYRCHRSYLVNKNNISQIDKNKRLIIMENGERCLISTRLLKGLINEIDNAM